MDPILKGATLTPRLVHDLLNVNLAVRVRVLLVFLRVPFREVHDCFHELQVPILPSGC